MVWRDDVDPHSCDGKGWPVIVEADVADAGLLPKWAGRHSPGPGDGAATVVAELVGDLADSPEPPASLVRAARFLGIPDTPPSRCCDRVYFCFVAIDFECDQHAGFSVCCDRPQWHRRGPYTPGP